MIRPAKPSDFDAITGIYNQSVSSNQDWANCDVKPLTPEQQRAYLGNSPVFVHTHGPEINGFATIKKFSAQPRYPGIGELAVYVDRSSRARFVGGRLAAYSLSAAEKLGYQSLIAIILENNVASVRGVKALGFRQKVVLKEIAFKCGQWINIHWYERKLGARDELTSWLLRSPLNPSATP